MKSGVKCAMGKSKAAVFITVLAVVLILFCALLYWNAGTAVKTEAQWDPRFLEALSLEQEEADRAGNDLVQTVEECVSTAARRLRPTRRWISALRGLSLSLETSRRLRSRLARGTDCGPVAGWLRAKCGGRRFRPR